MAGFRKFETGEVLTSQNVNVFLMEQSVMTFADDSERDAALSNVLREGLVVYNLSVGALQVFDGTDFVGVGGGGDVDVRSDLFFLMGA